jgi:hypothetical protein
VVQDYRIGDHPDYALLTGSPDAVGLDYAIGAPAFVGRGIGTRALWVYLRDVVRSGYPDAGEFFAAPDHRNAASLRVLDKLGFARGLWFDEPQCDGRVDTGVGCSSRSGGPRLALRSYLRVISAPMANVMDLYQQVTRLPAGKRIFSELFSRKAPYFATVRPRFVELRPNYAELRIGKRRGVQNHIGTVHVIAICNGLEAAMGSLAGGASLRTALDPQGWTCPPRRPPRTSPPSPRPTPRGPATTPAPVRVRACGGRDRRGRGRDRLWVTEKPARA